MKNGTKLFLSTSCINTGNIIGDVVKVSEITENVELTGGSQQEAFLLENLRNIKRERDSDYLNVIL